MTCRFWPTVSPAAGSDPLSLHLANFVIASCKLEQVKGHSSKQIDAVEYCNSRDMDMSVVVRSAHTSDTHRVHSLCFCQKRPFKIYSIPVEQSSSGHALHSGSTTVTRICVSNHRSWLHISSRLSCASKQTSVFIILNTHQLKTKLDKDREKQILVLVYLCCWCLSVKYRRLWKRKNKGRVYLTGMKAQRGRRGTALLFFNLGDR